MVIFYSYFDITCLSPLAIHQEALRSGNSAAQGGAGPLGVPKLKRGKVEQSKDFKGNSWEYNEIIYIYNIIYIYIEFI